MGAQVPGELRKIAAGALLPFSFLRENLVLTYGRRVLAGVACAAVMPRYGLRALSAYSQTHIYLRHSAKMNFEILLRAAARVGPFRSASAQILERLITIEFSFCTCKYIALEVWQSRQNPPFSRTKLISP